MVLLPSSFITPPSHFQPSVVSSALYNISWNLFLFHSFCFTFCCCAYVLTGILGRLIGTTLTVVTHTRTHTHTHTVPQYPAPCISGALMQGIRLALIDWAQPCVGWFYIIVNTGWMPSPVCEKNPQAKVLQPARPKAFWKALACTHTTRTHTARQCWRALTHSSLPTKTADLVTYLRFWNMQACLFRGTGWAHSYSHDFMDRVCGAKTSTGRTNNYNNLKDVAWARTVLAIFPFSFLQIEHLIISGVRKMLLQKFAFPLWQTEKQIMPSDQLQLVGKINEKGI